MSLLSDILSRVKQPETAMNIPPGLRNLIDEDKEKTSQKKRIALLAAIIILTSASGMLTFYFIKAYIAGNKARPQTIVRSNSEAPFKPDIKQELPTPPVAENLQTVQPATDNTLQPKNTETEKQGTKAETAIPEKNKTDIRPEGAKQEALETKTNGKNTLTVNEQPTPALTEEKPAVDQSARDRWLYMAQGYEAKKDYSNAINSYRKVISFEPDNFRAMNNIASILLSINSNEEAKVYLQKALLSKTDYVPALINMGIALARLGEAENAERYFTRVEALDSGNSYAVLNIAILHEKQGNYAKARVYYTKLKQLGDNRGNAGLERLKEK